MFGHRIGGKLFVTLACLLPTTLALSAQPVPELTGIDLQQLFPGATFDPKIPTQEKLLGFRPGQRPLRHPEVVRYFEALSEASPRAALVPYARSHENRPLFVLAVADERTIANLEAFRVDHARRMDPRGRTAEQDRQALAEAQAVAWIAYGIHGDELSSVDAAAAVAYWLVAGEDERARAMRRELVVLIDPCENPDGRERFLAQTTSFARAVPNPDTEDISHTTVWPWGRGNHYLFDLNRDWFSLVHPESARSTMIGSWVPQLMVDSHEMGADETYLFVPARHPFNPWMGAHVRPWWERFAADQARALDARGYGYYTREWNEEFFPGYGSSWANYIGSVGILYEMSGTEGTLVKKRDGVVRTYAQAVEHQVASSVANLGTLLDNRLQLLLDSVGARREAVRQGREGNLRAWVLPRGRHPERTQALAELLRRQSIEVLELGAAVEARGLVDARTGEQGPVRLPAGSYLVPLDQPAGSLARVLLDPHVPMDATFFREEREYLERGKGSRLYDTTAWSLILSYGVEAYWSGERPAGDWRPVAVVMPAAAEGGQAVWTGTVRSAAPVGSATPPPTERVTAAGALPAPTRGEVFAYVFEGTSDAAAFALGDLLQRGLRVRIAEKSFQVAGRSFERSAVVIEREGNPDDLGEQVAAVAARRGVEVIAVPTARAEEGPDLGGEHFQQLVAPRVAVWTGMPVSPSDYGALWHLLDYQMRVRFSGLDLARAGGADLSRYNVLVFPPAFGGAGSYRHMLGEPGLGRLKEWIEAGGTAIGIGNGAEFLADKSLELTRTRLRREALDKYPPVVVGIGAEEAERAGRFRAVGLRPLEPEKKDGNGEDDGPSGRRGTRRRAAAPAAAKPARSSPYDVAPLIGPGARPFVGDTPQGTPVELKPVALGEWIKPLLPPGKSSPEDEQLAAADARLRRFAPQGAFLRLELDNELWLAWGLPPSLDALIGTSRGLVAEPPVDVPARFADLERLHLGGLLWPEAAGRIARTAYATRERVGRGQVILFVDTPIFRQWTRGTRRLLLNAVLYGPGLGTRWSTPW